MNSIQVIIGACLILVTIVSMSLVGVVLYSEFVDSTEDNVATNARQVLEQVNTNLDYYFKSMLETSNWLADALYYEKNLNDSKIYDKMYTILNTRKDIVSFSVFSNEGQPIFNLPEGRIKERARVTEQDWFKIPQKQAGNTFFSAPHVQNLYEGRHNWVISLSREITYKINGVNQQGILLVDINCNGIEELCQKVKLGERGYVYIIDSGGNIVYHPQQMLINIGLKSESVEKVQEEISGRYFEKFNGENRFIIIDTVNYTRWRIVGAVYMDDLLASRKQTASFIAWTVFFCIIFIILLSGLISSKISKPIKNLQKSMKQVEDGNFDIIVDEKGEYEVVQLSKAFNMMITKIRHLMQQIVYEQEAKRKSELNALQAQINPHFLYNTLDSIVWMAENEKSNDVITMVSALAKLFRISISKGRNIITVREELEHAKNYLTIQKMRYKGKFGFKIEAEPEILQYKTMKLILQPIIENSIYHGIEYLMHQGMILITVKVVDHKLLYQVTDNGIGMSEQKLNNILASYPTKTEGLSGVGVKNVHERIKLYYGKEYGLEIESELDIGTTVRIWLPIDKGDEEMEGCR